MMRLFMRHLTLFAAVCGILTSSAPPPRALLYVDPTNSDVYDRRVELVAEACAAHETQFVCVWSGSVSRMLLNRADTDDEYASEIRSTLAPEAGEELAWAAAHLPAGCEVVGVLSGSDAGVGVCERLLDALGVPGRSNGRLAARRDKFEMHEALKAAGLACARQCVAYEWPDAQAFLQTLPKPLRAVLKPRRGSSSLRVGLAHSELHAKALFTGILANPSSLDDESDDASVLLQEYLGGPEAEEWVVDTISRDGEHRITTLWRYEKGEANGAPFVYFGQEPMGSGSAQAQRIAAYARAVLDALKWRWGPVHLEVMWMGEARGPVLVEANMGRWDSSDTKLITDVCFSGNVYDAAFAALLEPSGEAWAHVPPMPPAQLPCAGYLVELVSHVEGPLVRVRHGEALEAMESVVRVALAYEQRGEPVRKTIDLNSFAGEVVLMHPDPAVVAKDYAALKALQPTLFEVDERTADDDEAAGGGGVASSAVAAADDEAVHLSLIEGTVASVTAVAAEVARLAADVAARGAAAAEAAGQPPATLCVRFPLVETDALSLPVAPDCVVASRFGGGDEEPGLATSRSLRRGSLLLRAVRTAKDEASAVRHLEELLLSPEDPALLAHAAPALARQPDASNQGPGARVLLYVDPLPDYQEGAEFNAVSAAVEAFAGVSCEYVYSGSTAGILARKGVEVDRSMRAPDDGDERAWAARTFGEAREIVGVVCGSDGGLAAAERLQHALVPSRSNGLDRARRDKYLMNEALRKAGLPVAAQAVPSSWEEAEAFLRSLPCDGEEGGFRAVLKPRRGTGSVGVSLATSIEEARAIYEELSELSTAVRDFLDTPGDSSGGCVVQELLDGDEWIVDSVSAAGEHKVLALWKYDKGVANGAPFVYLSAEARGLQGPEEETLIAYARDALDALGWRWGPAHTEIRMTSHGPRLVEANAGRWNGLDHGLLATLAFGCTAIDATVCAYLDEHAFAQVPEAPPPALACACRLVTLVSSVEGSLVQRCHEEAIESLPSLIKFVPKAEAAGDHVLRTVDLESSMGYALLAHSDAAVVEADYATLRALQPTMWDVLPAEPAEGAVPV